VKQAVILAAGEGQRLRPFTVTKPKVMLFIAGKPILQYVIESLAQNGIRNIVLVVGYKKEQVFDYLGSGEQFGVDITYVTQENQLGTAHALTRAKAKVEDEFLVLQGDKLIDADTIAHFVSLKPTALLVRGVENPQRYDMVTVKNGLVESISMAGRPREEQGNIVSSGIYAFSRQVFDFDDTELEIPNVLNNMINQGYKVKVYETEGTWLDVVYPWDILSLNDAILHRVPAEVGGTIESGVSLKKPVRVGKDSLIRSNSYIVGPVVVGDNCDIGPNVCILPSSSVGSNVTISPFSTIRNSVIGDDVSIGPGSMIENSVIDKGCVIQGRFTASSGQTEVRVESEHHQVDIGAMLGEGCRLGSGVVAQPGVIIGNYSQIQALKLVSGRLPDGSLVV